MNSLHLNIKDNKFFINNEFKNLTEIKSLCVGVDFVTFISDVKFTYLFSKIVSYDEFLTYQLNVICINLLEIDSNNLIDDDFINSQKSKYTNNFMNYGLVSGKNRLSLEAVNETGNGFICSRGSLFFTKQDGIENYPSLYISGGNNGLYTSFGDQDVYNEDFVNFQNINFANIIINKRSLIDAKITDFVSNLDVCSGIYSYSFDACFDNMHHFRIYFEQFASHFKKNYLGSFIKVKSLNYSGDIEFCFATIGDVQNLNVARYGDLNKSHLDILDVDVDINAKTIEMVSMTNNSKIKVLSKSIFDFDKSGILTDQSTEKDGILNLRCNISAGEDISCSRVNYINCSNTKNDDFENISYDCLKSDSLSELSNIWDMLNIDNSNLFILKMHKFNVYHLLCSYSKFSYDTDMSITARGLSGEAYRGHIFWDEIFIMPFYLKYFPKLAKHMNLYRFSRLDAAKVNASSSGFDGAMFPWQSGLVGDEQTQSIHLNPLSGKWDSDHSYLQRHVSLAVAYNVVKYFEGCNDMEFMLSSGLELIFEIGKFFTELITPRDNGYYDLLNVVGPDEFHERYPNSVTPGINNNAYTNIMVTWLFDYILTFIEDNRSNVDVLNIIDSTCLNKYLDKMRDMCGKLYIDVSDGIICQYENYLNLKELDFEKLKSVHGNIQRLDRILKSDSEDINHYQASKQADLMMIFYLFDDVSLAKLFDLCGLNLDITEAKLKNYEYYLNRTTHGSTLSKIVFAKIALDIGRTDEAKKLFIDSLCADYLDVQGGTTAEGIHCGVMALTSYLLDEDFKGVF